MRERACKMIKNTAFGILVKGQDGCALMCPTTLIGEPFLLLFPYFLRRRRRRRRRRSGLQVPIMCSLFVLLARSLATNPMEL